MIFKRAAFNKGNEGTDLGLWILGEAKRRERPSEKNRCEEFILSYPRSGNHAVRFVVEFLSGTPTLGAGDQESLLRPAGLHDLPIFLRDSRINMEFPAPPLAIKRHKMLRADKPEKLIYIERNSVEAVLSHTNRGGNASDEDLRSGFSWWKELRDFYLEFEPGKRTLIRFKDILENNSGWIRDLAAFLQLEVTDKQIEECQKSLPQAKSVLTRAAKTTSKSTYTDLFPEKAEFLRSLQTSQ